MLTPQFQAAAAAGEFPSSCVYVRLAQEEGFVDVLDSKTRKTFVVSEADWQDFIAGVKSGEFDLPPGRDGGIGRAVS